MTQPQHLPPHPLAVFDFDHAPGALEVCVYELAVVTADRSDVIDDEALCTVLRRLREQHAIDAAFLVELVDGRHLLRKRAARPARRAGLRHPVRSVSGSGRRSAPA